MANFFQYGDFTLDSTNGISVNVVREKSMAERSIALLSPARDRGLDVLSITPKGKIIEIEGTISHDFPGATYTGLVRDFLTALNKETNLFIGTNDGTFVYENCVLLNPENILRQESHWNINFIPFRAEILAPKGLALSINITRSGTDYHNISESPYTNEIQIGGTANPDPIITLTTDSVGSGLSNLTFLNRDTQEQLSVATNYNSGDIVQIDTKEKQVRYNNSAKNFGGVFPRFRVGENRFRLTAEASDTLHQSQTTFDSDTAVYGTNFVSQQIQPSANIDVPQIDLLIKKNDETLQSTVLLDSFQDSTVSSEWNTTGTVSEDGSGRQKLSGSASSKSTTTSNKGWIGTLANASGNNPYLQVANSDNSKYVRMTLGNAVATFSTNGFNGESASTSRNNIAGAKMAVLQEGDDINVYFQDSKIMTLLNQTMPDMTIEANGGSSTNTTDFYQPKYIKESEVTVNDNLQVEIQTDSSGVPSGTPVTNGTAEIKISDIPSDQFSYLPALFDTSPSLTSSTDYHVVLKQDGGDANNFILVKKNTAGGYGSGNLETSVDSGTNWVEKTSEDLVFKLYGAYPTGWNIDIDLDYFITHHSVV